MNYIWTINYVNTSLCTSFFCPIQQRRGSWEMMQKTKFDQSYLVFFYLNKMMCDAFSQTTITCINIGLPTLQWIMVLSWSRTIIKSYKHVFGCCKKMLEVYLLPQVGNTHTFLSFKDRLCSFHRLDIPLIIVAICHLIARCTHETLHGWSICPEINKKMWAAKELIRQICSKRNTCHSESVFLHLYFFN